jgi:hypothetical protein
VDLEHLIGRLGAVGRLHGVADGAEARVDVELGCGAGVDAEVAEEGIGRILALSDGVFAIAITLAFPRRRLVRGFTRRLRGFVTSVADVADTNRHGCSAAARS